MSSIHQIQMAYQPVEDRILVRVSSTELAEFRFWMTRRYVKLLWTVLLKLLERDPVAAAHENAVFHRLIDHLNLMDAAHWDASLPLRGRMVKQHGKQRAPCSVPNALRWADDSGH